MQGLSPLAMLLSGLGQRDDIVTATDNNGNLVVMPKPGATPKLPGGAGASPVAAPSQAMPQQPQNPYVAAAQPAPAPSAVPAAMPGAAAPPAAPAVMPGAAAAPAAPVTPTINAPDAPQYSALPTPPTFTPGDMTRRQGYEATLNTPAPNANDKNLKPHWYDRLLGGLVGFGRGYVHDPNAMAEGASVTGRRFNTALGGWERNQEQAKTQLEQFDKGEEARRRNFQSQNDVFEDEFKNAQEERQRFDTGSKAAEREAKANKYDNAIDPQSVGKDPDGKWYGTTYGGVKKEIPEPKYAQQSDNKVPSGYEAGVYAEENEKDPAKKAALHRANQRIEATETKRFKYKEGAGGDNETPATKLRRSMQINKANADRQTQLRTLEKGDPAKGQMGYQQVLAQINKNPKLTPEQRTEQTMRLNEAHAQEKQQVEDQYAQALDDLGVDYKKVEYKPDGSFTREGESATTPAKGGGRQVSADEARDYLQKAGGDKQKARDLARKDGRSF